MQLDDVAFPFVAFMESAAKVGKVTVHKMPADNTTATSLFHFFAFILSASFTKNFVLF